jgi:hypothetical protein
LIGHLKTHFPPMYQLYLVMTSHGTPLTEDELKLARGEKVIDSDTAAAAYLTQLEQASANLVNAFNKQVNKAFGDWSQENLKTCLQNGSLHVINHSKRLKNQSSKHCRVHSPRFTLYSWMNGNQATYHEDG